MTNDDREPLSSSQAALVGAGFITGAVIVGGIAWWMKVFFAGDEPPIRVKGGSLHLDIGGGATWRPVGGSGKWTSSKGSKSRDDYDISIVAAGAGCGVKDLKGKKVTITYTEGTSTSTVEMKAAGNKTMVTPSKPLTLMNGDQRLTWSGPGYISKVEVDLQSYTFARDEFGHAVLTEF